jgi:DNA-binding transcriptional LysR family regulator
MRLYELFVRLYMTVMKVVISPSDMQLFATVVREGGFTRAAVRTGRTKQTISERIARLEMQLGVRLLERTTRRIRVTDAGASYYERCAAIALQIEEANTNVRRQQATPTGRLRVSAPVLYGRRFLAPVVSDYLCRYPQVRVEVVLADRRVDLIEEGIDLSIRIGDLRDSSLTARKLGEGYIYFVASPAFLRRHGTPTPRSLRTYRCIGLGRFETWQASGVRCKIDPVLVVNDHEVGCEAAIAGVGIARLPALVCGDAVRDGRLRVLFGAKAVLLRPVYVVYPSREYLPAAVRLFIDALAAMIAPMAPID